jgi:DNA-binding NtrC family response regulator
VLLDDDAELRQLLRDALERRGYRVHMLEGVRPPADEAHSCDILLLDPRAPSRMVNDGPAMPAVRPSFVSALLCAFRAWHA